MIDAMVKSLDKLGSGPDEASPASGSARPASGAAKALAVAAERLGPAGLWLLLAGAEGEGSGFRIQGSGGAGGSGFWREYGGRLLERWAGDEGSGFTPQVSGVQVLTGEAGVSSAALPGLAVAVFPLRLSRQSEGLVVVAGRSEGFGLTEEVVRACSRLGVDAEWLGRQASLAQGYDAEQIARAGELVRGMVADQMRLAGLEEELGSLSNQLANTYEELSLIYQISGGMRITRRAGEFFEQVCRDAGEVMGVLGIGVLLAGQGCGFRSPGSGKQADERLAVYGEIDLPAEVLERASGLIMAHLAAEGPVTDPGLRAAGSGFSGGMLLVNDVGADPIFGCLGAHARQLLAVPMRRQDPGGEDRVLGCLFALDKVSGEFDSVDGKLLHSIANESAIYLENANLFEDVHGLMMGLLHSLTSAVDAKDAYTCGHSERVALLSRALAAQIGLSAQQVERIYMAGLLHDVGKIGVPESVLQKTGRLTVEEFDQIKKHPQIGARILRDIPQIEDIIPGVMHHHERYDGKGYPSGLSGTDIPQMGRIICLADCLDAMTSNRTYRNALPLEVALNEIRRCAGTQFDPELAEAFLDIGVERFRQVLQEHQERSSRVLDLQEPIRRG